MSKEINKDKAIDDLLLLVAQKNKRIKDLEDGIEKMNNTWVKIRRKLVSRIRELDRKRAGARIMLIAARVAVVKGGEANEEVITKIIDELE